MATSSNSSIASAGSSSGGFGPALSADTFNLLGGAVKDIFGAKASGVEAKGLQVQAGDYRKAAAFARESKVFEKTNEQINEYQTERNTFMAMGSQKAALGGAGVKSDSGSSLYLMWDSARQGALAKEMVIANGQIAIRSHEEQAQQYESMAAAADLAARQAKKKKKSGILGGIIKAVAGVAGTVLSGGNPAVGAAASAGAGMLFGD